MLMICWPTLSDDRARATLISLLADRDLRHRKRLYIPHHDVDVTCQAGMYHSDRLSLTAGPAFRYLRVSYTEDCCCMNCVQNVCTKHSTIIPASSPPLLHNILLRLLHPTTHRLTLLQCLRSWRHQDLRPPHA